AGNVGSSVSGSYGSVTINADGTYTYVVDDATPSADASYAALIRSDTFSYQVSDGDGGYATAQLTITVHGTDDNPVANADSADATELGITPGADATGSVLTNDTDVDNVAGDLSVSPGKGIAGEVGRL